jgi:hypothetical protein
MPLKSAAPDESASESQNIQQVRALLTKALELVDNLNLSPEIGARIQEAICALESSSESIKS